MKSMLLKPESATLRVSPTTRGLAVLTIIAFFTVPIFRSGSRSELTMWQWLKNHTVYGPPVAYVPEEDYKRELSGD